LIPPNATLFISDLHLSPHVPQTTSVFLTFLQAARKASQLYILGDWFDVWLGSDIHTDFHQSIQDALKPLADAGVKLFFMSGNRDFLISSSFLKEAGCQKLSDPTCIDLYGTPTLLTHGDKLCTEDKIYQRYRRIVQHPFSRFLFLRLPHRTRQNIGNKLREKSRKYQEGQSATILDVSQSAVEKMMRLYNVNQMIHGHVHRPKVHSFMLGDKPAKRLVLGDWGAHGSLIISTADQNKLTLFDPSLKNSELSVK